MTNIRDYYTSAIGGGDFELEVDLDSVVALIDTLNQPNRRIAQFIKSFTPVPEKTTNEDQLKVSVEKLMMAVRLRDILSIKELNKILLSFGDPEVAISQQAVTQWMEENTIKGWSTNHFDIARAALLITANSEEAIKILDIPAFNPIITQKLRVLLGLPVAS